MNRTTYTRWLGGAVLGSVLVFNALPAAAMPVPVPSEQLTEPTQAAVEPNPAESPVPGAPRNVTGTETGGETPLEVPEPLGTGAATPEAEDAEAPSSETLEESVGPLGARMGQGLERLLETGDPQVPTEEEVKERIEAETSPEAPLQVPDLTAGTPFSAAAASKSGKAADGSFRAVAQTSSGKPNMSLAANWMPNGIQGLDVSSHQNNVDWNSAWNQGGRFAYVKATEGTYYKNPYYNQQYVGSANVGMVRGAYHFAIPSPGSAVSEAHYFVDNGGGWTGDGRTLPPLLDIEYNPYPQLGNTCYNMNWSQMVTWIQEFSNTIQSRTGRVPMIYTTTDWWRTCTGNTAAFANHPLHIASYSQAGPGAMPAGWGSYDVWQYSSTGPFVGDSNVWKGDGASLGAFAAGSSPGRDAITAKAAATPSLGSATSQVVCGIGSNGCVQNYRSGQIHWTAATGARVTKGGINAMWADTGWEAGPLGYPVSDEICGLAEGGCVQQFQGGNAYWTPVTGPKYTKGAIDTMWSDMGRERSPLGYPTTYERCGIGGGGCVQDFQGGQIHWSPATGARPTYGPVAAKWSSLGWEGGKLGYPTGSPTCGLAKSGCYQDFQGGQIHWTSATGAHPTWGAIASTWAAAGWERGSLGYPTTDEVCTAAGACRQKFEHGTLEWIPGRGVVRS